jgi:hypothetical protein
MIQLWVVYCFSVNYAVCQIPSEAGHSNEIVYDLEGKRVGYTEYASPRSVYGNPVKSVKRVKPTKMVRSFPKTRPIFSSKESSIRLKDFLEDGSVI